MSNMGKTPTARLPQIPEELSCLSHKEQKKLLNQGFASGANPERTQLVARNVAQSFDLSSKNYGVEYDDSMDMSEEPALPEKYLLPEHLIQGTEKYSKNGPPNLQTFKSYYKKRGFTKLPYSYIGIEKQIVKPTTVTIRDTNTGITQSYKTVISNGYISFIYIGTTNLPKQQNIIQIQPPTITPISSLEQTKQDPWRNK